MYVVREHKDAAKALDKAPNHIQQAYEAWKQLIELQGPAALRGVSGYRDHSLKGEWSGARSSSLNYQWRVIYVVQEKEVQILVLRVTPHDYRRKK